MLRRFASGSTTRRAWTFLWAPRHDPATPEPSPQTPTSPVFLLQFAQLVRSFSSLLQRGPRTYENRMPILDEALADVQMSSSLRIRTCVWDTQPCNASPNSNRNIHACKVIPSRHCISANKQTNGPELRTLATLGPQGQRDCKREEVISFLNTNRSICL
ncbi:hypothetical protein B0H13DRAFT_401747 [Mycena leptocephala]|nr:hypothetical protein B0H13DRAFT_401747 [Mycena leptocephala]